jgi:hypothetical protein
MNYNFSKQTYVDFTFILWPHAQSILKLVPQIIDFVPISAWVVNQDLLTLMEEAAGPGT